MIIFWRGWGIMVLFMPFIWLFIGIGIMIAIGGHEPDEVKAAVETDYLFSLCFALATLTIYLMARYRERTPREITDPVTFKIQLVPNVDEFTFIPMKYWTYVIAAGAVGMFIKSFFE